MRGPVSDSVNYHKTYSINAIVMLRSCYHNCRIFIHNIQFVNKSAAGMINCYELLSQYRPSHGALWTFRAEKSMYPAISSRREFNSCTI